MMYSAVDLREENHKVAAGKQKKRSPLCLLVECTDKFKLCVFLKFYCINSLSLKQKKTKKDLPSRRAQAADRKFYT